MPRATPISNRRVPYIPEKHKCTFCRRKLIEKPKLLFGCINIGTSYVCPEHGEVMHNHNWCK